MRKSSALIASMSDSKSDLIILSSILNLPVQNGGQYVKDPVGKIKTRDWYAVCVFVVELTPSVGPLELVERGVGDTSSIVWHHE